MLTHAVGLAARDFRLKAEATGQHLPKPAIHFPLSLWGGPSGLHAPRQQG
jgi:hypothetical protein